MSIRYHLMLRLFLVFLLLVGGSVIIGYQDLQHESRELFDAQLARSARLILSMVQADVDKNNFSSIQQFLNENQLQTPEEVIDEEQQEDNEELSTGHMYETKLGFQIWDNLGNLVLKSPNIPLTPVSNIENGFSNNNFLNNDWRIFSLTSQDSRYRCITAERIDVRNDLIGKISSNLFILFIILIPVLSITMWFAISQGLSSLQNLASQIQRRGTEKLDAVSEDNAPSEIKTITGALNQLLSKLSHALTREKRITSDAAHELRTPLAAVKIHAELAKMATSKEDRIDSINHVLLGIDRTTHLVDQILTLARLEPDNLSNKLQPVSLTNLVIDEVAMLVPLANEKQIEISVCKSEDLTILAEDTSLRLLIRNLLNNAVSYTHQAGEVDIFIETIDDQACLIIQDNGPGISTEDRERVLQRFYRVENHQTPGCGIGLSIVMSVVELLNANFKMEDSTAESGLKVTVCFDKLHSKSLC